MIKHIESVEQFEEEISKGYKVIDFYADWCGPCRMLSPLLEEYCEEHTEVDVLKVNVDDPALATLASKFGVYSIPLIITFVDGERTGENTGYLPQANLNRFLNSALSNR